MPDTSAPIPIHEATRMSDTPQVPTETMRLASRRRFFQFLASSPLLAMGYPALAADWRQALGVDLAPVASHHTHAGHGVCAACGAALSFQQAPAPVMPGATALDDQFGGQMIESVGDAVNVWDMEKVANANNLPVHWAYLHMGVDDLETRVANREGFMRLQLRPRRLGPDAFKLDTSTTLFGRKWDTPLFLCPVAALEAYHTQGEAGAGRAARAKGILQIQSHQSSQSYEQIAEARGEPHWFQLYANNDWGITERTIKKVAGLGCPVLVWTIDLLGGSNRELNARALGRDRYDGALCQNCHNHQKGYQRPMHRGVAGPAGPRHPFNWDYVKRLKDATPMKVILKGIVTQEEAELAVQNGADGVFVSNHGGRAENSLRSTIECLPEVVAGVKGRVPVFIDSGVRRGADIFKALALGADAVGIGRPYVWGLGAFGQPGVEKVIDILLDEFRMVMRQTRTLAIDQIDAKFVTEGKVPIMTRINKNGFGL
jgi:isopentenyl diphosphate isomerase/L-lactate dehydrogenase-like FMN-dependent dehydrogenase